MRPQNIDRTVHQLTRFKSVQSFVDSEVIPAGVISIESGGLPIDILNSPRRSNTLVVFFHGAIDKDYKLPVLSGLGISTGVDVSRVFISDPALYKTEELVLSWYAGSASQPSLQQDLIDIIRRLAHANEATKLVFFGGSGGGFASLFFSSFFSDSLALVFNPQTDIAMYNSRAIHDFTRLSYEIDDREYNPLSLLPETVVTDIRSHYSVKRMNSVAYIQNLNDRTHIERHMNPFLKSLHDENSVFLLADFWGPGHSPPPKGVLTQILHEIASSEEFCTSLLKLGFSRVAPGAENVV